jgi:hypothetical protein
MAMPLHGKFKVMLVGSWFLQQLLSAGLEFEKYRRPPGLGLVDIFKN